MTPSERTKKWVLEHPEWAKRLRRESAARIIHNPRRLSKRRKVMKKWYWDNREKMMGANRAWRAKNPWVGVADRGRSVLRLAIRRGISPTAEKLLGCTVGEFRARLERQWEVGMTWENFGGNGWTVGHIKAVALFKEILLTEEGKRACFHHLNLRPEWATKNKRQHVMSELTPAQQSLEPTAPPSVSTSLGG